MKLKTTLSTLSIIALSSFANAGEDCTTKCATDTKTVANKECAAGECDDKTAANATYVVTGMTCTKCSDKITTALKAVEGVTVQKVCHKSGHVAVNIDDTKTNKAAVQKVLAATGFDIAGEQLSIPVSGMTCTKCSSKLTAALNKIEGCTVGSVCHKSGHATVTIDTEKTSEAKILEAIKTTGYTVAAAAQAKS